MLFRYDFGWGLSAAGTLALMIVHACAGPSVAQNRGCIPSGCVPRGTLFQWSYGTSFSGGPDLNAPLVTDRPDFTEATSTVGRGVAQLEMGYTYIYDNDGTDQTTDHVYPEALLRVGVLADWLEFRTAWTYVNEVVNGNETSGSNDLYLGFKIGLTPQEGILPEMALIPQMFVPTGADAFSADQVLPGVNWIYGWELNDRISTAGSTQFNRAIDDMTADAFTLWGPIVDDCLLIDRLPGCLHRVVRPVSA
jgi:hypothetical protein